MQRLAVLGFVALLLSLPAGAGDARPAAPTAIFYYPWYGTVARDGSYQHWAQNGHTPPADIASDFYPLRGAYSSDDPHILDAQMTEIAGTGVREVIVSWWGAGSREAARLPAVMKAARAHGLQVAVHLEPYDGRTIPSTAADIAALQSLGVTDFYVYHPMDFAAADWANLNAKLHGVRMFAETTLVGFAKKGSFAGVYSYDIRVTGADKFARLCTQAHIQQLLCLPSVGPGFSDRRATGNMDVKPRRRGATYDAMWSAAIRAGADGVTITSFNEWHEGTQIEPARRLAGYKSYDGAWDLHRGRAARAYLTRTAYWTARFGAS